MTTTSKGIDQLPDDASSPREVLLQCLEACLYRDLATLVCGYLVSPFLLLIGGRYNDSVDVWMDGRWTSSSYRRAHVTDEEPPRTRYVMSDWTWHAQPNSMAALKYVIQPPSQLVQRTYTIDNTQTPKTVVHCHSSVSYKPMPHSAVNSGNLEVVTCNDGTVYAIAAFTDLHLTTDEAIQRLPAHSWYINASGCVVAYQLMMMQRTSDGVYSDWMPLGFAPVSTLVCGVAVQRDVFVLVEGTRAYRFQALDKTWITLREPRVHRSFVQPALDERRRHIYLIGGGFSCGERLDGHSCERLSLDTGSWMDMPLMNKYRWGAALAVFQDQLVALGGRSAAEPEGHSQRQADAECLSLSNPQQWMTMPPMPTPREDSLVLTQNTFT